MLQRWRAAAGRSDPDEGGSLTLACYDGNQLKTDPPQPPELVAVGQEETMSPFDAAAHLQACSELVLSTFPVPLNVLLSMSTRCSHAWLGVVAVDETNGGMVGFLLGQNITLGAKKGFKLDLVAVAKRARGRRLASRMSAYLLEGSHPGCKPDDYDIIIAMDTDLWNSPSWLLSDRVGIRYWSYSQQIRDLGVCGYLMMHLSHTHAAPCHFMKKYVRDDAERRASDDAQLDRGWADLAFGGLVPAALWALHLLLRCDGALRGEAVGYVFGATYLLLLARFALAAALAPPAGVAFRAYDFWCVAWAPWTAAFAATSLAVFGGWPLLGWAGGFYVRQAGYNYRSSAAVLGRLHVLPTLLCLGLFSAHTTLRAADYEVLRAHPFLDVLGFGAVLFASTDALLPTTAFPSGSAAWLRCSVPLFCLFFVSWVALAMLSHVLPDATVPHFGDIPSLCY